MNHYANALAQKIDAALLQKDSKGVHDLRRALKRLRALAGLYEDSRSKRHKKRVLKIRGMRRALGPYRDLEVFKVWRAKQAPLKGIQTKVKLPKVSSKVISGQVQKLVRWISHQFLMSSDINKRINVASKRLSQAIEDLAKEGLAEKRLHKCRRRSKYLYYQLEALYRMGVIEKRTYRSYFLDLKILGKRLGLWHDLVIIRDQLKRQKQVDAPLLRLSRSIYRQEKQMHLTLNNFNDKHHRGLTMV